MVSRLVKKIFLFPVRILSRTYRVITAATSVPDVLPVGGLSGERASGLLFALRQIIQTDEVCSLMPLETHYPVCTMASYLKDVCVP